LDNLKHSNFYWGMILYSLSIGAIPK